MPTTQLLPYDASTMLRLRDAWKRRNLRTVHLQWWADRYPLAARPLRLENVDETGILGSIQPGDPTLEMRNPPYPDNDVRTTTKETSWRGCPALVCIPVEGLYWTRAIYRPKTEEPDAPLVLDHEYADIGAKLGVELLEDNSAAVHVVDMKVDVKRYQGARDGVVKDLVPVPGEFDDTAHRAYQTPLGADPRDGTIIPALPVELHGRIIAEVEHLLLAAAEKQEPFWWAEDSVPAPAPRRVTPRRFARPKFAGMSWRAVLDVIPPPSQLAATSGLAAKALSADPNAYLPELGEPQQVSQEALMRALKRPRGWPLNGFAKPTDQKGKPVEPPGPPEHLKKLNWP